MPRIEAKYLINNDYTTAVEWSTGSAQATISVEAFAAISLSGHGDGTEP